MKMAEQFIEKFQEQVTFLKQRKLTPSTLALKGIYLSKQTLTKLKKWNEVKEFQAVTEEVHFFKNVKSVPMSYLIFFTEMQMCELRKPKAGLQFQTSFFKKELKRINKFFYRYSELSNYMETGQSYLDQQFFSKTQHPVEVIRPLINYTQFSEFETSHDLLWAKIKAMHKLIDYIRHSLEKLHRKKLPIEEGQGYQLKWTASKVAMTELVYALYSARAVNSGNADIKQIAGAFQNVFQIDLGDLYHTYGEIRARKIQPTKFIDHLKIALKQRMYDADE